MQIFKEGHHISRVIDSVQQSDFIASRTVLSPDDFNGTRHYHDNAHFSFVLRGGCAEVKRTHYERLPGSITWYEAGEPHQMTKVKAPSYHVNFELPENFFTKYDIKENNIGNALKIHPLAGIMMLRTYNELNEQDAHSEDTLRMLLLGLIQRQTKLEVPGIPVWVKIVQELLNDKWNENVTLAELSIACGIHPVTISRYFPVYFSFTFGQYCRMLKVRHAISMIRLKRTNLSEVAYACGFSDQSHFIRNFKAYTDILPATWQKL